MISFRHFLLQFLKKGAIMLPYRVEREWRWHARKEKCRFGARQKRNPAIHPGAGGDEPPGRAPYSAYERALKNANRGGNAVLPSLCRAVFLFSIR